MQTSFNKGLWSNELQNRFDIEFYRSACSKLENFTVLPQGGLSRRNGTTYLLECYDNTKKSVLVPLQLNKDSTFIVEFSGNQKMRILQYDIATNTLIVKQDNHLTGFTDAELDEIQWVQINKKLYVTHKNHPPRKLSRITDTTWLWTEAVPYPPASRLNRYDINAHVTLASTVGQWVVFTLNNNLLQAGDVGRFIVARDDHGKAGYAVIIEYTSANSGICNIIEPFNDTTLGVYEWYLQGTGGGRLNPQYDGPEGRMCSLTADEIAGGNVYFRTSDVNRYLEINGGFIKIVGYVNAADVRMVIIKALNDKEVTHNFLMVEGQWGLPERYPRTIGFYENRLFYGGTIEKPGNVWGSRSQFYNDFTSHANDEYTLNYLLSGTTLHEILWMVGAQVLIVGTTNGIWTIGREDTSAVLTPSTPMLGYQSTISCADIRPATIGNIVFFVQRNKKILRSFIASSGVNVEKATPTDETLFAAPFKKSNICQLVAQSNPHIVLWVTNVAGELWGLNYVQEQQVNSWFKFTTDGSYESLMVHPQENANDLLFTTVKRTIDGTTKRYIEYLHTLESSDSAKQFTAGGATHTLTGYTHLKTKDVWVFTAEDGWLRDSGGVIQKFTVTAGGNIDITGWTATVDAWAGLPHTAEAKTMNWYGGSEDYSIEQLRRLTKLKTTVLNSITGEVGVQVEENVTPEYVPIFDTVPDPAWTGVKEVCVHPGTGRIIKLCIKTTDPTALTVTGLGCNLK
jgi:hypothetical protein